MYKSLTPLQKLYALAAKNYQGIKWTPQTGDYYTSARADLELYQVIEVKDGIIKTIYCDKQCSPQSWDETEFTTIGFGLHRVHVPLWILEQIDTNKCNIVPDENHVVVEILPENVAETLSSEIVLLDLSSSEAIYEIRALKAAIDLRGKHLLVKKEHVKNEQLFIETHKIWLRPNTWRYVGEKA